MATHRIPILNFAALPDTSGNVFFEPASLNFGSNDRYPHLVAVFKDTATRIGLRGLFTVPKNYVGSPKIVVVWGTPATTGAARWEFDYTAVAKDAESLDPSADQESVGVTDTAKGTARQSNEAEAALTAANLAADDLVLFGLYRDGTDAADTLADSAYLFAAYFEYADA